MRSTAGTTAGASAPNSQTAVPARSRRAFLAALGLVASVVAACAFAPGASAAGGNYVIQGGTSYEQSQVRQALDASSFNWSLVQATITIEIDPSISRDQSVPGQIFLSPALLDAGEFGWGAVQNEYAQQVDFFLLTDAQHAIFNSALGGTAWCYADAAGLQLSQYGCERFASTLAWSYWSSPLNCIQPAYAGAVASGMSPAAFRAFLTSQLGVPTTSAVSSTRQTQSARTLSPKRTVRGLA